MTTAMTQCLGTTQVARLSFREPCKALLNRQSPCTWLLSPVNTGKHKTLDDSGRWDFQGTRLTFF
jgi:hypothetical protein